MTAQEILETIKQLRAMGATNIEVHGVKCVFPPVEPTSRVSPEQEQRARQQQDDEDLFAAT